MVLFLKPKAAISVAALIGVIVGATAMTPALAIASPSYVCRYDERKSGRTGTIVGALAGGAVGGSVADTHNKGLGTVLGAVAGGIIGNKVGRDNGKRRCEDESAYRTRTVYETDSRGHRHKVIYRYIH